MRKEIDESRGSNQQCDVAYVLYPDYVLGARARTSHEYGHWELGPMRRRMRRRPQSSVDTFGQKTI